MAETCAEITVTPSSTGPPATTSGTAAAGSCTVSASSGALVIELSPTSTTAEPRADAVRSHRLVICASRLAFAITSAANSGGWRHMAAMDRSAPLGDLRQLLDDCAGAARRGAFGQALGGHDRVDIFAIVRPDVAASRPRTSFTSIRSARRRAASAWPDLDAALAGLPARCVAGDCAESRRAPGVSGARSFFGHARRSPQATARAIANVLCLMTVSLVVPLVAILAHLLSRRGRCCRRRSSSRTRRTT